MKPLNLKYYCDCHDSFDFELFKKYMLHLLDDKNVKIRNDEVNCIKNLLLLFNVFNLDDCLFDNFYLNFQIPQISKEFDLLRFTENTVINIELKTSATKEDCLHQLKQNSYYLDFLGKNLFLYTYILSENILYKYEKDNLVEADISFLVEIFKQENAIELDHINDWFKAQDYLISVFNDVDSFINGYYFLTGQQLEFKRKIIDDIKSNSNNFFSIIGKAGTGKTLLTYDIAKELMINKKLLIIHCGQLNTGHLCMKMRQKFNIISIKDVKKITFGKAYDIVIVDEAQRISEYQLKLIIDYVDKNSKFCIFSYDSNQTLGFNENSYKIIEEKSKEFKLSNKIRINKELANFIQSVFIKNKVNRNYSFKDVEIIYKENNKKAKEYIIMKKKEDFIFLNYTSSSYHTFSFDDFSSQQYCNSHRVLGQEFNKVIVTIDNGFKYIDGELEYNKYYWRKNIYNPTKMLYQNMTRVKEKLLIIVISNQSLFTELLDLFDNENH